MSLGTRKRKKQHSNFKRKYRSDPVLFLGSKMLTIDQADIKFRKQTRLWVSGIQEANETIQVDCDSPSFGRMELLFGILEHPINENTSLTNAFKLISMGTQGKFSTAYLKATVNL